MSETTKLQALWFWLQMAIRKNALAVAAFVILAALGATWMATREHRVSESPPRTATAVEPKALDKAVTGNADEATTSVIVHGDGIAAGRDTNIEGGLKFGQ